MRALRVVVALAALAIGVVVYVELIDAYVEREIQRRERDDKGKH